MNAIAIDDSPSALEILRKHSEKLSWLTLSASFKEALPALDHLSSNPVDIVFVDIEMPGISGVEFIRIAKNKNQPQFIITSAHDQYAIEGFELNVTDFLLKPISYERYLQAVEKVRHSSKASNLEHTKNYVFLRHNSKLIKLHFKDILLIQSDGHFAKVYLKGEVHPLMLSYSLVQLEKVLSPSGIFVRIHKQFIINVDYVTEIGSAGIGIEHIEKLIPIGSTYRPRIAAFSDQFHS